MIVWVVLVWLIGVACILGRRRALARNLLVALVFLAFGVLASAFAEEELGYDTPAGVGLQVGVFVVLLLWIVRVSQASPGIVWGHAVPLGALTLLQVTFALRLDLLLLLAFTLLVLAYARRVAILEGPQPPASSHTLFLVATSLALWASLFEVMTRLGKKALVLDMSLILSSDPLRYVPAYGYAAVLLGNVIAYNLIAVVLWAIGRRYPEVLSLRAVLFAFFFLALAGIANVALEWLPGYAVVGMIYAAVLAAGIERQLASSPAGVRKLRRSLWVLAPTLAAIAVAMPAAESLTERASIRRQPSAPSGKQNVLLIVMDTARRESFSVYGYPRKTSPQLERWAARGVVFDNAIANSSWTLPSHASMFTGRWCHEHEASFLDPLDDRYPTLAEVLRDAGYRTSGFAANVTCARHSGLARGFQHYVDHPSLPSMIGIASPAARMTFLTALVRNRDAAAINEEFLSWLDHKEPDKPFLTFLNYIDLHFPYAVPDSRWDVYSQLEPSVREDYRRRWKRDPFHFWPTTRQEIQAALDTYDATVAYLDDQIGRLLDAMEDRGILDDTLVIITSDHGEHFGENGHFTHGTSLYRQTIDVPLMALFPDGTGAGERIRWPVGLEAIPSTVVDWLNLDDGGAFTATSWLDLWNDANNSRVFRGTPILSHLGQAVRLANQLNSSSALLSIIDKGYHYIQSADGRYQEVFDFWSDRSEEFNLLGTAKGTEGAADLQRELFARLGRESRTLAPPDKLLSNGASKRGS